MREGCTLESVKIVLTSDSHREYVLLQAIQEEYPDADYYIDCGDTEIRQEEVIDEYYDQGWIMVEGNCDYGWLPSERILTILGHKIWILHGDDYMDFRNQWQDDFYARILEEDIDLVLYGHTHVVYDEQVMVSDEKTVRLINPGSVARPRDIFSFDQGAYGLLTITEQSIDFTSIRYNKYELFDAYCQRHGID
jgi:putative phosphoesterase